MVLLIPVIFWVLKRFMEHFYYNCKTIFLGGGGGGDSKHIC